MLSPRSITHPILFNGSIFLWEVRSFHDLARFPGSVASLPHNSALSTPKCGKELIYNTIYTRHTEHLLSQEICKFEH